MKRTLTLFPALCLFMLLIASACTPEMGDSTATVDPLFRAIDLDAGERAMVAMPAGDSVEVHLLAVEDLIDSVSGAVRSSTVKVEIDGEEVTLVSAPYELPVTVGPVQIDVPVTKRYLEKARNDSWGLVKDARFRLWPAGSPWINLESFVYPARQKWFASLTQMANEPVYVDGGERPDPPDVYYHNGLDIGGFEERVEVIAAIEGLVVSAGDSVMAGYAEAPIAPRYDVVYLLDHRGWYYRYSHLFSIDPAVRPGARVAMRQPIGMLGKEGGSGGWSHLHFEITGRQPSGKWGTVEGYAFLWQAYLREHDPDLIAVARPHHIAWTGETVTLDASRSWSKTGDIASYEWITSEGITTGASLERTYETPGSYSEVLRVRDATGREAYDFSIVQVLERDHPDRLPPTIHAVYTPTQGIKPGTPVTLKVRSFRTNAGEEVWDFGDGSEPVHVQSDGNADIHAPDGYAETTHTYEAPGSYLVQVSHVNEWGYSAVARLHIVVDTEP